MSIDLSNMSKQELLKLRTDVDIALEDLEVRRQKEAREAIEAAAQQYGFTVAELVNGKAGKATKTKGNQLPKYRHPENPDMTWTGKGRKPKWYLEYIENGGKKQDLAIA
jgi:DNA-binding protein H-NS